jgi:hypothetical protein
MLNLKSSYVFPQKKKSSYLCWSVNFPSQASFGCAILALEGGPIVLKILVWLKNGSAHQLAFIYSRPVPKSAISRLFPPVDGSEESLIPDHPDRNRLDNLRELVWWRRRGVAGEDDATISTSDPLLYNNAASSFPSFSLCLGFFLRMHPVWGFDPSFCLSGFSVPDLCASPAAGLTVGVSWSPI